MPLSISISGSPYRELWLPLHLPHARQTGEGGDLPLAQSFRLSCEFFEPTSEMPTGRC
jgi:hypothetical protein